MVKKTNQLQLFDITGEPKNLNVDYSRPHNHKVNVKKKRTVGFRNALPISQADKMQCALRLIWEEGTAQSCAKRFGISAKQALFYQSQYRSDLLIDKSHGTWNPKWDSSDTIHHILDTATVVDIQKDGTSRKKDFHSLAGMMDEDFDGYNGVCHYEWDTQAVMILAEGVIVRVLTLLRDSDPSGEGFQEAEEWLDSLFFKVCCKCYGLDADTLSEQAKSIVAKRDSDVINADCNSIEDAEKAVDLLLNPISAAENSDVESLDYYEMQTEEVLEPFVFTNEKLFAKEAML